MQYADYSRALDRIRQAGAALMLQHPDALAWRAAISMPISALWLPDDEWSLQPEQEDLCRTLLPRRWLRWRRLARSQPGTVRARRISRAVSERLAFHALITESLQKSGVCFSGEQTVSDSSLRFAPSDHLYLWHTQLGQPRAGWRGDLRRKGMARGLNCRNLQISFTHDGGSHLAIAASAPGLAGIGVDMVHLPRLQKPGKDARYLRRFAQHFMSEEEYSLFEEASAQDDLPSLTGRVAAHFSLMEAASKALGTGLKIGAGMGRPDSLPKQSLNIGSLSPSVTFLLGEEARARCAALRAQQIEGYWSADAEYLVSVALLWEQAAG
jgi:phosphopantetheinyl transferase (holo-ACP synthase)